MKYIYIYIYDFLSLSLSLFGSHGCTFTGNGQSSSGPLTLTFPFSHLSVLFAIYSLMDPSFFDWSSSSSLFLLVSVSYFPVQFSPSHHRIALNWLGCLKPLLLLLLLLLLQHDSVNQHKKKKRLRGTRRVLIRAFPLSLFQQLVSWTLTGVLVYVYVCSFLRDKTQWL